MKTTNTQIRGQAGFTLVELAVVMIIIGLLIGGVLKGQELINSAQVTSTVTQIKGYDAALSTFRDSFNAFPGDIASPTTRLPGCDAGTLCAVSGDGNNQIGVGPGAAQAETTENVGAWAHLASADLISGVNPGAAADADALAIGVGFPAIDIGSSALKIGFSNGALDTVITGATIRRGHYLLVDTSLENAADADTVTLTPLQAQRLDTKLDDGNPTTGSVLGMGTTGNTGCALDADNYNTASGNTTCGIYVRVQS